MKFLARRVCVVAVGAALSVTAFAADANGSAAGEYAKHFGPLGKLSVQVAEAMPAEKYGFKPHPDSMNFGELMSHIATTN